MTNFKHFLSSPIRLTKLNLVSTVIRNDNKIIPKGEDVTIEKCCFIDCQSVDYGGAMLLQTENSFLNIKNCQFEGCHSENGGVFYSTTWTPNIKQTMFSNCYATNIGNIIYATDGPDLSPWETHCWDINEVTCIECPYQNDSPNGDYLFYFEPSDSLMKYVNITGCQSQKTIGPKFQPSRSECEFRFINILYNVGDVLLYLGCSIVYGFEFINIINNVVLGTFAVKVADNSCSTTRFEIYQFSFFNNTPSNPTTDLAVFSASTGIQIKLVNCNFDKVYQMNGHISSDARSSTNTQAVTFKLSFFSCVTPPRTLISPSNPFSESSKFSHSSHFTASNAFTDSKTLPPTPTKTNSFTKSSFFTKSSYFTESQEFTSSKTNKLFSDTFTPSNVFTPSNIFTPAKTKVPDPQGFMKADVSGESMFSKEELIKAAAPTTLSLAFIIISIVLTIIYIKKKVNQVQQPDGIPDFDSSLNESTTDFSDSSYSYYTYSYSSYEAIDDDTSANSESFASFTGTYVENYFLTSNILGKT